MPGRYIVPVILAGISLQVAVLGMYWDVGYHIDHGRNQGVFTAPHMFIVAGLQGGAPARGDGRPRGAQRAAAPAGASVTARSPHPSPQSHRPGVPVAARSGPMTSDTFILQREARGGPRWLTTTAYAVLAVIVAIWLGLLTWALRLAEPDPIPPTRSRATVPSTWPPPVAPA